MVVSVVPPSMVDTLRRVRRCRSGTHLWTCCAGRAGACIRSEALHRVLTIGRPAADRSGAHLPTPRKRKAKRDAAREGKSWSFRLQLAKCESFSAENSRDASPAVSAIMFQAV